MNKYEKIMLVAIAAWATLLTGIIATKVNVVRRENTYYLPAEVLAVSETSTYFGCENGHIYAVSATNYPDQFPYLLCMDPCGTEDPTDDMVLVVWRAE